MEKDGKEKGKMYSCLTSRRNSQPSGMARRKTILHTQGQDPKSKVSAREYYNKRYEEVDKKYRSTGPYADITNLYINRIEGLWRVYTV